MSYMPDYEVYINGTLYNPIKFNYQRPLRSIGTTPTCAITLDNQIGYLSGIILNGQEVEIYRNNTLRFLGVIDGVEETSNESGSELNLTVNNKWYKKLQNLLCDAYDFQEDTTDYGVTVNPWLLEVYTSQRQDVNGVSEYVGEPPAIDGFTVDEAIEHVAGTKFLHMNGFDTRDFILPSNLDLTHEDGALLLPKTGTSGDDLTYDTTGTVESIPLYNGDPNIEPMGDIQSCDVTLWGEATGNETLTFEVTRNGGTTGDVSGRDWQEISLTKTLVEVVEDSFDTSVNFVSNPGFETYTTSPGAPDDWNIYGDASATVEKETTEILAGSNSVKITETGDSDDDGIYSDNFTLPLGFVEASCFVKGDGVSTNATITLELYNATTDTVEIADSVSGDVSDWTELTGTVEVTSDTDNYQVRIYSSDGGDSSVAYIDSVSVYESIKIDKWSGSIPVGSFTVAEGNSLAYRLTLVDDGTNTSRIEQVKLVCLTDSDAGLTRGTIETFFGDTSLDGADFFEGDLNGLTRLRAADQVQKSALKVYDENNPVEDDIISAFWDAWIDDAGSINFRKNKGSEINDTFSFDDKKFNAISKLKDTSDLWWKVVAYGAGSGVLRTRIVSDEEFTTGGLKIQNVLDTYGDSAKIGKFEDKSAKSVRQLYQRARAQLKLKSNPITSIKLPNGLFSDPVLDIDTGDLLMIEVPEIGIDQFIGIHSMDVSVNATEGEQTRVTIGEPVTDLTDVLRDLNQSSAISGSVQQDRVRRENFQGETFDIDTTNWSEYSFVINKPEQIKSVIFHAFTDGNSAGDIPFNIEFYVDPDTVPPTSPADDDKLLPGKYGTPANSVDLGEIDVTNLLNKSSNNNISKGVHRIAFKSSGGSTSYNGEGLVKCLVEIVRRV